MMTVSVSLRLISDNVAIALVFSSAKLNYKRSATLKLQSEKRGSSCLLEYRKAAILLLTVVEKVMRSCPNRRSWSMLLVT